MELLVADIQRQLDGEWALLRGATASPFSLDWGRDDKLRLPRMELSLFGVPVAFPVVELEDLDKDVSEDVKVPSRAVEGEQETAAGLSPMAIEPLDAGESAAAQASKGTSSEHGRYELLESRDAHVSAVETCGTALQAETSVTERQAENMDGALLQGGKDGDCQLAAIQKILATHSRAEILLELEWARQALRDRRRVRLDVLS